MPVNKIKGQVIALIRDPVLYSKKLGTSSNVLPPKSAAFLDFKNSTKYRQNDGSYAQ